MMPVLLKIGIIHICTGNYADFFDGFFQSAERHFVNGHELHYFVFTDGTRDSFNHSDRVHVIPQSKLDWPHAVLAKFRIILGATLDLQAMDYLFMVNANLVFQADVGEEVLPGADNHWLVGVQHPYFYDKNPDEFPYERSHESTAHIPLREGRVYFAAGLAGGRTGEWLELVTTLHRNTEADYIKGIIALWHDESHINRYFLDRPPKVLSPSYMYPEGVEIPFEQKIVVLDKGKRGGHGSFRSYRKVQQGDAVPSVRRLLGKVKRAIISP